MTRKQELLLLVEFILLLLLCIAAGIYAANQLQHTNFGYRPQEHGEWNLILISAIGGGVYAFFQIVYYITYKLTK